MTNKDGKNDKDRGEIDVSLQFYSKNNTTGSVLDLSTKKKHLSLKDIKHSLGKTVQHIFKCMTNDTRRKIRIETVIPWWGIQLFHCSFFNQP